MEAIRPSLPVLLRRGQRHTQKALPALVLGRPLSTTRVTAKSTTARTKRALNIAPHVSFLSPFDSDDHIVFNPPASTSSVYNTPYIFLPPDDPRRQSNLVKHLFSDKSNFVPPPAPSHGAGLTETATTGKENGEAINDGQKIYFVPQPVKERYLLPRRQHLEEADIREIQHLRQTDPAKWTVQKLARKFDCPPTLIMYCGAAPDDYKRDMKERREKLAAQYGPVKRKAIEERHKRDKALLSGEL